MCDFWARINVTKSRLDRLVDGLVESIAGCRSSDSRSIEDAYDEYWSQLGIRNRNLLCEEEPDLCEKMRTAENLAESRIAFAKH
jgi:hypothetical protein